MAADAREDNTDDALAGGAKVRDAGAGMPGESGAAATAGHADGTRARRRGLLRTFLSYYRGQMHLFIGDIVCATLVAGIDLAFPQILRVLTAGLFTRGGARSTPFLFTWRWASRGCIC